MVKYQLYTETAIAPSATNRKHSVSTRLRQCILLSVSLIMIMRTMIIIIIINNYYQYYLHLLADVQWLRSFTYNALFMLYLLELVMIKIVNLLLQKLTIN